MLPELGMNILNLASDPEISMEDMAREIHQDPSLAARVLKVANSPFYGLSREVDSLRLALVILGLIDVRNIALGVMVFKVMDGMDTYSNYDREKFWTHSSGCAVAARILGRKLDLHTEGGDFTAGLLHDMGKIIIDEYFNEEFVQICGYSKEADTPMIEAEREVLGDSHERIAGWLAEKWSLPETLCEAIKYHYILPPPESGLVFQDPKTVALIYVAEAFCDANNVGWDGDSGCNDIKNEIVWDILLSGQDKYSQNDIDAILDEVLDEFEEASLHPFQ
jgi:HD-like signal output (HDOD) protein